MGNWATPTFARWWLEKLGMVRNTWTTRAMQAGRHYKHRILDALNVKNRDRQIRLPRLRLRVNLDGELPDTICEVKTYGAEKAYKPSRAHVWQCNIQMFAAGKWCRIDAYRMEQEDYRNYYRPIDYTRLSSHPVAYDPRWVDREFLPRLEYLAWCLERRATPDAGRFVAPKRQGA